MTGTIVNLFEDGKLCRGTKGEIIINRSKRKLIRFYTAWDDEVITAWFIRDRRNNGGRYYSWRGNMFLNMYNAKPEFIKESREWFGPEYYEYLFPANPEDNIFRSFE